MEGLGFFGTIIIGGLAGWLAGMLMDLRFGVFMNIVIGVVGAALATAILERAGIWVEPGAWGGLVSGFLGACGLLFVAKLVRR